MDFRWGITAKQVRQIRFAVRCEKPWFLKDLACPEERMSISPKTTTQTGRKTEKNGKEIIMQKKNEAK